MSEKEYKEFIYKKANEVKNESDLLNLIKEISEFQHDYGTIVYGCMAAMKAAFKIVNNSPQGGITGFQAGCLGWECISEFMSVKPPCALVDYNKMLYPQHKDEFDKTISLDTWEDLRNKAQENIKNSTWAHPKVLEHWKSMSEGKIPFGYTIK